jgi:hypothetical protein
MAIVEHDQIAMRKGERDMSKVTRGDVTPETPREQLPELLTVEEAAAWCGTYREKISRRIKDGTLWASAPGSNPLNTRARYVKRDEVWDKLKSKAIRNDRGDILPGGEKLIKAG